MNFSVYSILSLSLVIVNGAALVYVALRLFKGKKFLSPSLFLLVVLVWQIVELISRMELYPEYMLTLWRLSSAFTSYLGIFFFFTTASILQKNIKTYYIILALIIGSLMSYLSFFTDKIILTTEKMPWGDFYIYGRWAIFYILTIDIFLFLSAFLIYKKRKKENDPNKRKFLSYLIVGFVVIIAGGSLTDLVFPYVNIKVMPIGGFAVSVLFMFFLVTMKKFGIITNKFGRFSISTQIFIIFFLIMSAYVAMSNYVFNVYGIQNITSNLSVTTEKIGKVAIDSASESITKVISNSFVGIGTKMAIDINEFFRSIERDILQLGDNDFDDREKIEKDLLSFYENHKSEIWYNANTDLEPKEIRESAPLYHEVSFVSATGTEIIRIVNGNLSKELRDVSIPGNTEFENEKYFQKTKELSKGDVYVSRVNTWYVSTEEARKDMPESTRDSTTWNNVPGRDITKTGDIKFSTPVYREGELIGIIVLSLDYRHLQELVKHIDPAQPTRVVSTPYEGNYILLFDDLGDTIVHPKPNNIRGYVPGGQLKNSNTIAKGDGIFNLRDYDKNDTYRSIFNNTILQKKSLVTSAVDVSGRRKMTVSVPIFYDKGEYSESGLLGGLMLSVSTENFYESLAGLDERMVSLSALGNLEINRIVKRSFVNYLLIASLTALALLIFLMLILHRTLFRPLKKLTKASEEVGKGRLDVNIDSEATNEIGDLAAVFKKMIASINASRNDAAKYSAQLEDRVRDKTEELETILQEVKKDRQSLKKQRTATLNILEDVSESQLDLKKANDELASKTQELAALKSLSDEFASVLDIFEAVMIANKYLVKFFNFTTINYLVVNPAEEGGIIYATYLQEEVSENYLRSTENDMRSYMDKRSIPALRSARKIIKSVVPKYLGKKLDNTKDFKPLAYIYFPLVIGEKNLGVIQMSTRKHEEIVHEQVEFIKAIVLALSFSIDRLETLILAQHSKTVSLVESLTDGVVMFNSNKDVVLMNPSFAKFTGFSREYFNLSDLYKLLPEIGIKEMVGSALDQGKVAHVNEAPLIKRFYEIFITPVRDNKGKIVGGAIIIHDITYLKEIDQMKTEFVSVASHQLRTPLTAIKLFTEMLVRGDVGKLNKEQQEYLENVNESTQRMVSLVNDLLNVTRIESGRLAVNPQPTNMISFIKNIIAEAKPLVESKNQKIVFNENNTNFNNIPLDENLIRQVIHNLVVNAIRYSPEKTGEVNVSIEKKDEDYFIISVSDNGIGIPEEAQRRVFEKFFRADNAIKSVTEGTGLGLYVSKMIIESSGGKVWFKSESGKGTVFYVQLPIKGMKEKKGERGLAIS